MSSSGRPQDVWKRTGGGQPPARSGQRTGGGASRWFLAAFLVVGIGGTIAGLLFYLWPERPPVLLAIPVAAYAQPDWPPNPWGEADARAFLERSSGDTTQTFQAQEKQAILRELNRAAEDSSGRPIIVYLSVLGATADGKVYLIPGDGRPESPVTWLALDEVLSPLRRSNSPRLLILDLVPASDPRAVLMGEDVNEQLDSALAKLTESGDLPYFVLTANTPAEGANVFRPLQCTAFGLALAHAAGGAADGWNPERKRNGRVSVRELAAYTRELTHYASISAGFPPQLPRLHGTGIDFDLFRVPHDGPSQLPTLADPEPCPAWLQTGWKDRDDWVLAKLHLRSPRLIHQLTLTSTRAEQRWLAGGNGEAIHATFDATTNRLREVRPTLTPVATPTGSVARAQQKTGLKLSVASDSLQGVFNRILELPGAERDKALAEAMKAAWDKPVETEPFDATALAVFTFAQNLEKPTHEQMKQLSALIAGFKPHPPKHAELLALSLIGGLAPEEVERWPVGAIATLIQVARAAEDAVACGGHDLPWIKGGLAKADETRRIATNDLCNPKSLDRIRKAAVENLETVRKQYETIRAAASALEIARSEYEETRAVLVDLAISYPIEVMPIPEVAAKLWGPLVEDFVRVQQLLRSSSESRLPDVGELGRAAQSLRANREQLRSNLTVPDSGSMRQFESLLRWPHWSQGDRMKLLAKLSDSERTVTRSMLDNWPKEPPNRELPALAKSSGRVVANSMRDLSREQTILRLVDSPEAARIALQLDQLTGQAQKIRVAMRQQLAETYRGADPERRAFMGWAVDPDDVPAFPQAGTPGSPNPELVYQRILEKEFHDWLAANRYAADAKLFGASTVKSLQTAAAGYREIARMYSEPLK
ncbi:MAG TPA: hypothetical protein VG097_00175 [Gemmata sp.]|nr:hypothetical protein [Gemmata sp.]